MLNILLRCTKSDFPLSVCTCFHRNTINLNTFVDELNLNELIISKILYVRGENARLFKITKPWRYLVCYNSFINVSLVTIRAK